MFLERKPTRSYFKMPTLAIDITKFTNVNNYWDVIYDST